MKRKTKIWLIVIAVLCVCVTALGIYAYNNRHAVKKALVRVLDGEPIAGSTATNPPEVVHASVAGQIIEGIGGEADAGNDGVFEILALDTKRFQERFALPDLARMEAGERSKLVDSSQVLRRMTALGVDPEAFQTPEVEWKRIYNYVTGYAGDLAGAGETVAFDGKSVSELNALLKSLNGKAARVEVQSVELRMDETLVIPTGAYVTGGSARLTPGEEKLDRAVLIDEAQDCGFVGFCIEGGCDYGVYIKNSRSFVVADNDISSVTLKGIVMMGAGERFVISNNYVHENGNGGIFMNGGMRLGVLEGNRVIDNGGARNLTAGIVMCSMEIEDIDTAYNTFKDVHLYDIVDSPNNLVLYDNTVARNMSSGIYSDSGYLNYIVDNDVVKNEKEGMCFDYGSFGNYIARNNVQSNGGRNRMSDDDLKADFVLQIGRLSDGSSPAKLPGISLDNTAYNTLYGNVVSMNYGSGIKAVRSAYRNLLLCNQVSDNSLGSSDVYHFFGIEFSADMNADQKVVGLDFTPCYENIVARNMVSGAHYAAVYLGEGSYINDFFDNTFMGCTDWSMECLSVKYNASVNNMSNVVSRGISLSSSVTVIAVPVAGRVD